MKSKTPNAAGKASLDPLVGPCPFCGATATTVRSPSGRPMQRVQHAVDCYFGGAHLFVENDDRIAPWNRRQNAHALAEERSDDSQQRVVGGKVDR